MLSLPMPRKPTPILARGAPWLRLHVRPTAFGNALGESLVSQMQSSGQPSAADNRTALNKVNRAADSEYYGSGTAQASDGGGYFPSRSVQMGQTYSDAYGPVNSFAPTADASGNIFGIAPSDSRGFFPNSDAASVDTGLRPGDPVPGTMGPRHNGPDAFTDGIAKSFADDAAARKAAAGTSLWDRPVPGLSDLHGYVGQTIDDNFGNNWLGKGLNLLNDFAIPATYGDLAMTGLGIVLPEGRALGSELKLTRSADELASAEISVAAKAEFRAARRTGLEFSEKISGNYFELESSQKFAKDGSIVPALGVRSELVSNFRAESGDLFVNFYRTTEEGHGVGTEMLSRAIENFGPEQVKTVSAELGLTNKAVFRKHYVYTEGLTTAEAVQRTPIGKSLSSLGYGQIDVNGLRIVARR
ncbi:MAG: hypothetical protein IPO19_15020 [Rhodoferax sp.]|nr:hypothetical protein [Rhodoferax sp.]